jgi:hypothetical protein
MDKVALKWILALVWLIAVGPFASAQAQEERVRPFVYAGTQPGALDDVAEALREKLRGAGFTVVGGYAPDDGSRVLVVTHETLRAPVRDDPRAAYGAVVRIGLSKVPQGVQVAYTNPVYFQHAYRIDTDFSPVLQRLGEVLGAEKTFGSKAGLTPAQLRRYHYAVGMEYFDNPYQLGEFPDHEAAVAALEKGLEAQRSGVRKVYRLDLGPKVTLYGVSLTGKGRRDRYRDERFHLRVVDTGELKRVAYLPYEILVDDNRVEALHMRFRMALHFPDTNMVGRNSFMKLRKAPGAVGEALMDVVGAPRPKKPKGGGVLDYSEEEF